MFFLPNDHLNDSVMNIDTNLINLFQILILQESAV